jgi:hypothetical protein
MNEGENSGRANAERWSSPAPALFFSTRQSVREAFRVLPPSPAPGLTGFPSFTSLETRAEPLPWFAPNAGGNCVPRPFPRAPSFPRCKRTHSVFRFCRSFSFANSTPFPVHEQQSSPPLPLRATAQICTAPGFCHDYDDRICEPPAGRIELRDDHTQATATRTMEL